MSQLPGNTGVVNGPLNPTSNWGLFNRDSFVILQWLAKMQTVTLVKVVGVTNDGDNSPVGSVDILPLVNQIDGVGNGTPHGIIYGVPYFRLQGGSNAIILDPQIGDIGMAAFASRDISVVKATKAQANPGTFRQYHFSDALYFGGVLNGAPTQYISFSSSGIKVISTIAINFQAPDINLTAPTIEINATTSVTMTTPTFTVNGSMNVSGDINGDGVDLKNHVHNGVQSGSDETGPPV